MNQHRRQSIESTLDDMNSHLVVIMTAEQHIAQYVAKVAFGEDVESFTLDGLCKTLALATEALGLSVNKIHRVLER